MKISSFVTVLCALAGQGANAAITLDLTSDDSIKSAAAIVAADLMSYYTGDEPGDVPGNLPQPYYWWEAGAMFGCLINYWYLTGDTTYNNSTVKALLHQAGDDGDFMPVNQTKSLGNDDQGFWGMAAMSAAETKFQNPPDPSPGWLALAQGVFNTQVERWDTSTCNGGFRWQIFQFNQGYNYKNTISNGCFFNLAARLALYTGNATYAEWAEKTYDWVAAVGLISDTKEVFDGTQNTDNCTSKDHTKWTYNAGVYLIGSAAMYNYTNGSAIWKTHTDELLEAANAFFVDDVMYEGCESTGKCNVDQRSFKAYLARWLASTAELAPWTHDSIMEKMATSAAAAVKTCTAGDSGTMCGLKWNTGSNDGSLGVGEQMAVLEIIQGNLVDKAVGWVSEVKGTGNSTGDVNAGSDNKVTKEDLIIRKTTTADLVGAGFLTAVLILAVIGCVTYMVME